MAVFNRVSYKFCGMPVVDLIASTKNCLLAFLSENGESESLTYWSSLDFDLSQDVARGQVTTSIC